MIRIGFAFDLSSSRGFSVLDLLFDSRLHNAGLALLFGISEMSRTRHPAQKRQSTRVKFGPSTNHDHKGLMNRLLIIAMAFALMTSAVASHAALGWTLDESIQTTVSRLPVRYPMRSASGERFIFSKPKAVRLAHFTLMARSPALSTHKRKHWKNQISRLSCSVMRRSWFGFPP